MADFVNAVIFILTLLNPFLMIVYLTDVVRGLPVWITKLATGF
jgi:hypothetical protein